MPVRKVAASKLVMQRLWRVAQSIHRRAPGGRMCRECRRGRVGVRTWDPVTAVGPARLASLNSSLLAISPLCFATPRAVDQDGAGTGPRCHWLVGGSGRALVLSLSLSPRLLAGRPWQANPYPGPLVSV